jgi:hypothetical protein
MRKRKKVTADMMAAAMKATGLRYGLAEDPDSIELNAELNETVMKLLAAELKADSITHDEYDRAVATLRESGWRAVYALATGYIFRK